MKRTDFHYQLPDELIAQYPLANRRDSRLLALDGNSGEYRDLQFADLPGLLNPGDLLVFNNTRVIPARLHGTKESGGKVEVLVERLLDGQRVLAHVRASKSPKAGSRLLLESSLWADVEGRDNDLFILKFSGEHSALELLEQYGHMPLPPYIQRADENPDRDRYQTVYAERPGAVAAPTAGLHFDKDMLEQLQAAGIETAYVTLHVGAGTFQPVRADNLEDHHMHSEWIEVSEAVCAQVKACQARGNRIIAIGTTAVRCLETAAKSGEITPYCGDTDIFIYPGYQFNVIDAMVTNFHLPESTLLMLISAFAGYTEVMQAYAHAVEQQYRFFSYGDAMFITRKQQDS